MGAQEDTTSRQQLSDGGTTATLTATSDEDTGNSYLLALEEDEIPMFEWRWMGRILVWRLPCGNVYIGPHWYCSLIMLGFILAVGGAFISSAVSQGQGQLGGGILATSLSTITFLRCALANPGVLKARDLQEDCEDLNSGAADKDASAASRGGKRRQPSSGRRCKTCNLMQPQGCSHCEFCQVCVEGFDHHCPWMGKCIGRNNMCAFRTFMAVSMTCLGYVLFATVLCTPPEDSARPGLTTSAPGAAAAATGAAAQATAGS